MSKASALGAGVSFGRARAVSARRAAIEGATAAPTDGAPPPVELPVGLISLNPENPRSELGDLTDLAGSMRDHGQKTAISIMSRYSYLEANPGKEEELEEGAQYVAIDGNTRLAAAREAGLETIKVMLDDGLGGNPDELLESALVANIHRADLKHLDEARALDRLLKIHGTQTALAARLHRSQGWVAQRLALLDLTPELKQKLESGEESAELLRRVGRKEPDDQEQHLQRLKDQKAEEDAARKQRAAERAAGASKKAPTIPPRQKTLTPDADAVGGETSDGKTSSEPKAPPKEILRKPTASDDQSPLPDVVQVGAVPWGDVDAMEGLMCKWMTEDKMRVLVRRLAERLD